MAQRLRSLATIWLAWTAAGLFYFTQDFVPRLYRKEAVPWLREAFQRAGPQDGSLRTTAAALASRIDSQAAQQLVLERLHAAGAEGRAEQAEAIRLSWNETRSASDRLRLEPTRAAASEGTA